jgi:hypothetical protein
LLFISISARLVKLFIVGNNNKIISFIIFAKITFPKVMKENNNWLVFQILEEILNA